MIYNLWDIETGGYFGQFTDEAEALHLVRTLLSHHGADYAESLSLGRVRDDGSFAEPLSGAGLAARAEEVAVDCGPATSRQSELVVSRRKSNSSGYSEGMPMAARGSSAGERVWSLVQSTAGKTLRAPGRGRRGSN